MNKVHYNELKCNTVSGMKNTPCGILVDKIESVSPKVVSVNATRVISYIRLEKASQVQTVTSLFCALFL